MKTKLTLLIAACLLLSPIAFTQAPNSFKYQAIVRKADGSALKDQSVSVRISILAGNVSGTSVYSEVHSVTSNSFGIINLNIGEGSVQTGIIDSIKWSAGLYFVKVEIDETGGSNYTLSGTSQLLSVPYALYSDKAGNGFSGNYNDLNNKPNLSDTSKYLEVEADPFFNSSVAKSIKSSDTSKWNNKSNFSGIYNDLKNKPNLFDTSKYLQTEYDPVFNVSVAKNIKTTDTTRWGKKSNFSGNYNELTNKPNLSDTSKYLKSETDPVFNASVAKNIKTSDTTRWGKKSNFSGNYSDLTNKPNLSDTSKYLKTEIDPIFNVSIAKGIKSTDTAKWNAKSNFSGIYSDLKSKPNLSDTSKYLKSETDPVFNASVAKNIKTSDTTRWGKKSNFSGNYSDLTNKPNLSDTSKYLKTEIDPIFNASIAKGIKTSDTAKWNAKSNFSGKYSDLTNIPTFAAVATSGDYINLKNKPAIPDTLKKVTLDAGNKVISNILNPVNNQDAATKAYVDLLEQKIKTMSNTINAGGVVKDVEGNVYQTVSIGSQTWMAENLRTTKYNDGTSILMITDNDEWRNSFDVGAYSWYDNNEVTYKDYGALYNWYTTDKLCPSGWHIPDTSEWNILVNYLGGSTNAGIKLFESGFKHWHYFEIAVRATNESGFTALPGGDRDWTGQFFIITYGVSFWTSSHDNIQSADCIDMQFQVPSSILMFKGLQSRTRGCSIRCIKN